MVPILACTTLRVVVHTTCFSNVFLLSFFSSTDSPPYLIASFSMWKCNTCVGYLFKNLLHAYGKSAKSCVCECVVLNLLRFNGLDIGAFSWYVPNLSTLYETHGDRREFNLGASCTYWSCMLIFIITPTHFRKKGRRYGAQNKYFWHK